MEKKTAVVIWFSAVKGFGFGKRSEGGKDIFIHYSNIVMDGFKELFKGDEIEYDVGFNDKGQQAENITLVKRAEQPRTQVWSPI